MVGFRQIGQAEIDSKGLREARCVLRRHLFNDAAGGIERGCLGATSDGKLPQRFDGFKERVVFLFANDIAEQAPERADVAVQWAFFEVWRFAQELVEALVLVDGLPEDVIVRHGLLYRAVE